MKYERLDKEQIKKDMLSYIEAFSSAETFEEANNCFLKFDKLSRHVDTMDYEIGRASCRERV